VFRPFDSAKSHALGLWSLVKKDQCDGKAIALFCQSQTAL
jgi:hypothetical protein